MPTDKIRPEGWYPATLSEMQEGDHIRWDGSLRSRYGSKRNKHVGVIKDIDNGFDGTHALVQIKTSYSTICVAIPTEGATNIEQYVPWTEQFR